MKLTQLETPEIERPKINPNNNEIFFVVDCEGRGRIVFVTTDLHSEEILHGSSMTNNGIDVPEELDYGYYRGNLSFTIHRDDDGETEINFYLEDITPIHLPNQINENII